MPTLKKKGSKKNIDKHKNINNPPIEYISRNRAIKKLQITVRDFRRLCILKGIYPQIPTNEKYHKSRTYYYKRDINFINRDPILAKMRELKTYSRKKSKFRFLKRPLDLKQLKKQKPAQNYDHLVKERYPNFSDALNDLNDPLSLLCLFSNIPSRLLKGFGSSRAAAVKALCADFRRYVVLTNSLTKGFVSLKGFYFEAKIQGVSVVWLEPHRFCYEMPQKADYGALLSFLDFYSVLLKFVNFKLFHDAKLDQNEEKIEQNEKNQSEIKENNEKNTKNDKNGKNDQNLDKNSNKKNLLFDGLVFLLMRETPFDKLSFVIESLGGKVILQSDLDDKNNKFYSKSLNSIITHKISDRNLVNLSKNDQKSENSSKNDQKSPKNEQNKEHFEIIQPQWVFDCLNEKTLLPCDRYGPNERCPDHLSPFVDSSLTGYSPEEERLRKKLKNSQKNTKNFRENDEIDQNKQNLTKNDQKTSNFSNLIKNKQKNQKLSQNSTENSSKNSTENGQKSIEKSKMKILAKVAMTGKQRRQYKLLRQDEKHLDFQVEHLKKKKKRFIQN